VKVTRAKGGKIATSVQVLRSKIVLKGRDRGPRGEQTRKVESEPKAQSKPLRIRTRMEKKGEGG